jgi:predicted acylesterase/phospholipase RssA
MPHELIERARSYLSGEQLTFDEANALWKGLKGKDEISLARRVLAQLRSSDELPPDQATRRRLCQQEALLTSKDPEFGADVRHDRALRLLAREFDLDSTLLDHDPETLGIAGGIRKRRWADLGQLDDLLAAARLYARAAGPELGDDAYPHINAAFLDDLLASVGNEPDARRERARLLRERIVRELPPSASWFNAATRAEALFGLRRYREATEVVGNAAKPEPWELQTTARQLGHLAHLHEERPLERPEIHAFFDALLPGGADVAASAIIGRVGLALSGGGFRASFYHLGVLARLAELDVLRHLEVLSCVSGGSIVGACYWLALRRRLLDSAPLGRADYTRLVQELIEHFRAAVVGNLRRQVQPSWAGLLRRLWNDERGALDPERAAQALEREFFRPLMAGAGPIWMHDLEFTPADHDPELTGSQTFHPGRHNWLRCHKVPVLVLNATTVNTGHAWQFTPTWMGESPWAIHEAADAIPRLEWAWYAPEAGWQIELGRAVAASACVPGVFAPLCIDGAYDGVQVQLVDGGVYDNQGTASLLALNCNVVLVSDACGQLMLEKAPTPGLMGLLGYANRSMSTLMERVRLAGFADLAARRRAALLRGLLFLHMKAGLDADPIRRIASQEAYHQRRAPLTPSGVRKDFQTALAELRTDLDAFTEDESNGLMACGYQMAAKAFALESKELRGLASPPSTAEWPFAAMLAEIRSTAESTPQRAALLAALREGSRLRLRQ